MFKKKPTIKTLSPIRSSDRRKIADRIIADFDVRPRSTPARQPETSQNSDAISSEAEAKAAATAAHTALRNLILPDNALSARFSTTVGPDLKEVLGTVYIGSYGNSREQRVLWVSIYDKLYPSVYMLWKLPGLIPLVHTPNIVVQKMKNGADLMTPGLAGPPFLEKAKKGAVVAVADLERPSVPVAVGTCRIDISALRSTQGEKGCAIETFHWAGDELWDWSTSGRSGIAAPEALQGWLEDDTAGLTDSTEALSLEEGQTQDQGGGVQLDPSDQMPKERLNGRMPHLAELGETAIEEGLSTDDIDDGFRKAFLYGVYQHKQDHEGPKYGLDFPLTQSFVMSDLIKPYLPAFTQKQTKAFEIKKTSWKNLRRFIKSLEKEKLLISKDRDGNETTVLDIDFDDRAVTAFQPYSLPRRDHATPSGPSATPAADTNDDPSLGRRIKRVDLYRPKESLGPLFAISNASYRALYTLPDLNPIISRYFEHENLVQDKNKRQIRLDPFLANALFDTDSSRIDAEIVGKGVCNRDVLIDRIRGLCTSHYVFLRNDETLDSPGVKPKAGAAPKIEVQLETRGGNKTVTRIWGLEMYGIREQTLADELRKTCASSTSVEPSKQGKGVEVMVQGPQKVAVIDALEKRGIVKQWIEVVDKTKGKKK